MLVSTHVHKSAYSPSEIAFDSSIMLPIDQTVMASKRSGDMLSASTVTGLLGIEPMMSLWTMNRLCKNLLDKYQITLQLTI